MMMKLDASKADQASEPKANDAGDWDSLLGEAVSETVDEAASGAVEEAASETATEEPQRPATPRPCCFCGSFERDEDGECAECHDPRPDEVGIFPIRGGQEQEEKPNANGEGDIAECHASDENAASDTGHGETTAEASEVTAGPTDEAATEVAAVTVAEAEPAEPVESPEEAYRRELMDAMQEICDLTVQKAQLKEALKDTEAALKVATKEFEKISSRGPEKLPLLDGVAKSASGNAKTQSSAEIAGESAAAEPTKDTAPEDDSWRADPVSVLVDYGLAKSTVKVLAENGEKPILTIGDLADWTSEKGKNGFENPLCQIDKVGPAKAEKIQEALDGYWAKRRT